MFAAMVNPHLDRSGYLCPRDVVVTAVSKSTLHARTAVRVDRSRRLGRGKGQGEEGGGWRAGDTRRIRLDEMDDENNQNKKKKKENIRDEDEVVFRAFRRRGEGSKMR